MKATKKARTKSSHGRSHVIHQRKMVVNTYTVLDDCVLNGVQAGYRRAFKHTSTPDAETIQDQILKPDLKILRKVQNRGSGGTG